MRPPLIEARNGKTFILVRMDDWLTIGDTVFNAEEEEDEDGLSSATIISDIDNGRRYA